MSAINLCRLCVKVCTGYTSRLYDESCQRSIIYELALTYFHSMFLNVNPVNADIAVLCSECCHHIANFYNFQQTIFEAQGKLLEDKLEIEYTTNSCDKSTLDDKANSYITVKADDISLPDLQNAKNPENHDNHVAPQTTNVAVNCFVAEDFGDKKQMIVRAKSYSAQAGDPIAPTSATSGWKTEYESEDNLPKKAMKRKGNQWPDSNDLDAVIAQWKPRLECAVCIRSLRSFKSLSKHFRNEHPPEKCHLTSCHRRFYLRGEIEEHARLHLNPETFKCEACESCHVSRNALYDYMCLMHWLEHKGDTAYSDKNFRGKSVVDQ